MSRKRSRSRRGTGGMMNESVMNLRESVIVGDYETRARPLIVDADEFAFEKPEEN